MEKEVINGKENRCREKRQGRPSHPSHSFVPALGRCTAPSLSSPLHILSPPHLDVSPPRVSVRGEIFAEL